ncbi:MAG: TolC family protein [Clostridium sp.]|nr:TolC family protein [Clostridium sp.]
MNTRAITLLTLGLTAAAASTKIYSDDSNYLCQAVPERWEYTSEFVQQTPDDDTWWKLLGDETLDSLIDTGVRNNFDVSAALHRIEAARAQVAMARSGYYPTITIDASWQKTRTSGVVTTHRGPATTTDYFSVGASASWEIDIFGKVREGVRQKKAAWRASRAEYAAMQVSVAAEIATNYIDLRVAQAQLAVARDHIASQERVVKIAEARHETGLVSALDVAQARSVYYSTLSTVPSLENQIHTDLNAIATLLGIYADQLPASVRNGKRLPQCDSAIAIGIPADLLRRRPDLAEAEANLAATAAAVGIARKDFLPTLSLSAQAGTDAHRAGDLFTSRSFGFTVAPTLSWTLFSGFSRKAAVTEARAEMEAQIDSYNLTVMNAVTEVDNAMDSYNRATRTVEMLRDVVNESERSLKLSTDLYTSGNSDFTNVADAQISFLTYTNELISAEGNALTSLVNLYRSLGGGWDGEY